MAGNQVTLTFAGDADKLVKESQRAARATKEVADSTTSASRQVSEASASTSGLTDRLSKLGNVTEGAIGAFDSIGGSMQAVVDIQQAGAERASRLARAQLDVAQATEDAEQATRDLAQAGIDSRQAAVDVEQATLDKKTALEDYNKAVKEHGRGSNEAKQAEIDLKQAGVDLAQAHEDQAQATRDASQAAIDAKTAQQDLNDAQREANPPDTAKWAEQIGMVTPLLSGLVGVVGLATAAQWSLNLAWLASPITWIVVGVAAVVAGIIYLATQTRFFQTVWEKVWGFLKGVGAWFAGPFANFFVSGWKTVKGWLDKAGGWFSNLVTGVKTTFAKVTNWITAPFKAAFNAVSRGWNATVGQLHFSVPSWVPGIGGSSFSAPRLPTFHTGGHASGAMGQEFLAVLRSGERVTATGGGTAATVIELRSSGSALDDALVEVLARAIRIRGGDVQLVLGSSRG